MNQPRPINQPNSEITITNDENLFRALFYKINKAVAVYKAVNKGEDFEFVLVNPAAEKLEKIKSEKVIGRKLTDIFPVVREFGFLDVLQRVWKTGKAELFPLTMIQRGEKIIWRENYIFKVKSGEIIAVFTDETAKISTENSLRTIAKRLKMVFDNTNDGIAIYQPVENGTDFIFVEVNKGFEKIDHFGRNEVIGKKLTEMFPTVEEFGLLEMMRRVLKTGIPEELKCSFYGDNRIQGWRKNYVYKLETGEIIVIYTDETKTKQLERENLQRQKMEAIGTLAGGVAHDFNNLLMIIQGYTSMSLEDLKSDSSLDKQTLIKNLTEVEQATQKAHALTQQLLSFSRKDIPNPTTVDLNRIIEKSLRMFQSMIGERIQLSVKLCQQNAIITADPNQIEQIFLNLIANARDALPNGGSITISTKIVTRSHFERDHPALSIATPQLVLLTIRDNGIGMAEDVKEHLFEPFFTTKSLSKGAGLGLSTVYGICKRFGGQIQIESQLMHGTGVTLYFPLSNESAEPVFNPESCEQEVAIGGNLLVVEDDLQLLHFMVNLLEKCQYTVKTATNGLEALKFVKSNPNFADIIITDIVMPVMSGIEFVDNLHALHIKTPIIFVSGYTEDEVLKHSILERKTRFLQKPFKNQEILQLISEILEYSPD